MNCESFWEQKEMKEENILQAWRSYFPHQKTLTQQLIFTGKYEICTFLFQVLNSSHQINGTQFKHSKF